MELKVGKIEETGSGYGGFLTREDVYISSFRALI